MDEQNVRQTFVRKRKTHAPSISHRRKEKRCRIAPDNRIAVLCHAFNDNLLFRVISTHPRQDANCMASGRKTQSLFPQHPFRPSGDLCDRDLGNQQNLHKWHQLAGRLATKPSK
jgi:hypothetical protein